MSLLNHATCWAVAVLALVASRAGPELTVSPRPGSEAAGLNSSHPTLPGNLFDFRTRLTVWSGGQPLRLDRTEHARRQVHLALLPRGEPRIEWAWWINSTNPLNEPLTALASHDGQWTAGLGFKRAAWASANTGDDRACFHLFPQLGRIERGASARARGAFWLVPTAPESLRQRVRRWNMQPSAPHPHANSTRDPP